MAAIPGFEHDIFISYAHVDNEVYPEQKNGWVDRFYESLKLTLARRFGRMDSVNIWWDDARLRGNSRFDNKIAKAIEGSAIFLCLHSHSYIASEYCLKELNAFHKKVQDDGIGLDVNDDCRIIHMLLFDIPYTEWPKELSGITNFTCFEQDEKEDTSGETLSTNSVAFQKVLRTVTGAIWKLVQGIIQQKKDTVLPVVGQPATDGSTERSDAKKFTIFLGEVADTLRPLRKKLISDLEKRGYQIATGVPPPHDAAAHQQKVEETLQSSNLAVHLLDEYPGGEIAGMPEVSYPQQQAQIALEKELPKLIWVPEEANFSAVEDLNYKGFLENLENGKTSSKPYEFIRSIKSSLTQEVIRFADNLKKKTPIPPGNWTGRTAVLLDTHLKDESYALDLSMALFKNQIFTVISPQEDDPMQNMEKLKGRISRVNKLIFLYGNVEKEWVVERMNACVRLVVANNYPVDDFFIYMAPPLKLSGDTIAIPQRYLKINIFDSSSQPVLTSETLQRFLNLLTPQVG